MLGLGLDLNLVDGEEKDDIFGEALDLAHQRSLRCFCVVGEILGKYFVVDGDILRGAEMGFGVNTLGSLKGGGCCGFSIEEALDKMESSCKSSLHVMVSDGDSRGF